MRHSAYCSITKYGKIATLALAAIAITGCNYLASEPVRVVRNEINAFNGMSDALSKVTDASSARDSAEKVKKEGEKLLKSLRDATEAIRKNKDAKIPKSTADALLKDMKSASERFQSQMERIDSIRGLPLEFWKVLYPVSLDISTAGADQLTLIGGSLPITGDAYTFFRNSKQLYEQHGFEKMAVIQLTGVDLVEVQKAYDRLRISAGGVTLWSLSNGDEHVAAIAPVENFQKFVEKIDIGTVLVKDEGRRLVKIQVDPEKLMTKAEIEAANAGGMIAGRPSREFEEARREEEERERRENEERARQAAEAARKRKEDPTYIENLSPFDPEYYDKLADVILADRVPDSEQAMDVLLKVKPDEVESADTRKKIARAFKQAVTDKHRSSRSGKAILGMGQWGGKFSVPYLLELLEEGGPFDDKEAIYEALGKLKDERAAAPVAEGLKEWTGRDRPHIKKCLKKMGPVAEDAVIAVAPSPKADVCLAAIDVLGDIGTKKSLTFLRESLGKTRNPEVKAAIKSSIRKIVDREAKAKDKAKKKEDGKEEKNDENESDEESEA